MQFPRACGVLLHPTSLPGPFGIGDLGPHIERFLDFLAAAGQTYWQILPLGPTGYGDSPYACFSAFAGNPFLVSPEYLVRDGLLAAEDLADVPDFAADRVEFGRVIPWKNALLATAFERFRAGVADDLVAEFAEFRAAEAGWLEDYALFRAIKDDHNGTPWNLWESDFAQRVPHALDHARDVLAEKIDAQVFYQWLFFRQWASVRAACAARGISIIGDVPIFVAYDSSDVWANPELFKLKADGTPTEVSGVPPDYFSATGQLWGNPLYNWEEMAKQNFSWWTARVKQTLRTVDVVRMDHFRGFAACWEVPFGETTAINGQWVPAPGEALFRVLNEELGDLPILAEDLGIITPDVEALRDGFGFPGMRILQFAFTGDQKNGDLPHNYIKNAVAYTGTHDNDTTVGWYESQPAQGSTRAASQIESERKFCLRYLNSDGSEIHWDFIRAVYASVADTALVPAQDILGLGNAARMNLPGSDHGHWGWRFIENALTPEHATRLNVLADTYGRLPATPNPPAAVSEDDDQNPQEKETEELT